MMIHDATAADLPAILAIYNDAVQHTTAIWNETLVDLDNRQAWLNERTAAGFPVLVAHNNGLFEAEGIKAERPVLLRSWAQVIEAFISGQVNVIHLLSPMTVWARYGSQVPAKVVAWNHVGGSGLTVAPGITEVKQLGGKSVAIPFWYSMHNVVLQQLLTQIQQQQQRKSFGVCHSCRFHQQQDGRPFCGLTRQPLPDSAITLICREHQNS